MPPKFTAKYEENKQVLIDFCEIFHQEKCEMTTLISVGVGGTALLVIMLLYANPGGGTTAGLVWFLIKYVCVWAATFFAADIVARTFFRKLMMSMALGDAEELYRVRIRRRTKPLIVNVGFYDDRIVNDTGTNEAVFMYSKIKKLLETDKAIGFLAKNGPGPKNFFGVPKNALKDGDVEELKAFLLEKCVQVKKFKQV